MNVSATIKDGKVVNATDASKEKAKAAQSSGMDKEAFLKLLVAQMKYQDPLQPTSNTEYVAQYAQFSQVEQMQSMSSAVQMQRAGTLVGEQVVITSKDSAGHTETVEGKVDFVSYERNKAYVSVGGKLYNADDVSRVSDSAYKAAYDRANGFLNQLEALPQPNFVNLGDVAKLETVTKAYANLSQYEKSFVPGEYLELLGQYQSLLAALKKEEDSAP